MTEEIKKKHNEALIDKNLDAGINAFEKVIRADERRAVLESEEVKTLLTVLESSSKLLWRKNCGNQCAQIIRAAEAFEKLKGEK